MTHVSSYTILFQCPIIEPALIKYTVYFDNDLARIIWHTSSELARDYFLSIEHTICQTVRAIRSTESSPSHHCMANLQTCVGFMITNEFYPIGCCYLKSWLPSQNNLVQFSNNIVGQTYQKQFSGLGTEPAKDGYTLVGLRDSPNHDITGACRTTLDSCFDLCKPKL